MIKELPNDILCEKAILGTILSDRNVYIEINDLLSEETFYSAANKAIFRTIKQLADKGQEIDLINVSSALKKESKDITPFQVAELCEHSCIWGIREKAMHLYDLSQKRKLWYLGQELCTKAINESFDPMDIQEQALKKIEELNSTTNTNDIKKLGSVLSDLNKVVCSNMNGTNTTQSYQTGFRDIDKKGGFQLSDLIVIAADTSTGKSSFALNIAVNIAMQGNPIAVYSMEMTNIQLAARATASATNIDSRKLLFGRLSNDELNSFDRGLATLENIPLYFDERSTSKIDTILSSIRTMQKRYGIKGAIIDYIQILNVNDKNGNKEQAMGEAARRLKNLAKELNIFIVVLSQLNRDKLNPIPSLARLRDSGQIAEASDVVILLYRPELTGNNYPQEYANISPKNTCLVDIAKGRNIGVGKFIIGFKPETTTFYDLDDFPQLDKPIEGIF